MGVPPASPAESRPSGAAPIRRRDANESQDSACLGGAHGWGPDFDVWNIPYTQSTLVVDIIDARTNMLVWRGYDTDNIDVNKADKTIGKAVDSLVKRFVKETREKS